MTGDEGIGDGSTTLSTLLATMMDRNEGLRHLTPFQSLPSTQGARCRVLYPPERQRHDRLKGNHGARRPHSNSSRRNLAHAMVSPAKEDNLPRAHGDDCHLHVSCLNCPHEPLVKSSRAQHLPVGRYYPTPHPARRWTKSREKRTAESPP